MHAPTRLVPVREAYEEEPEEVVTYYRQFDWRDGRPNGFSFMCNRNGTLLPAFRWPFADYRKN